MKYFTTEDTENSYYISIVFPLRPLWLIANPAGCAVGHMTL